jgi:hypothetical protein
MSHKIEDIKKVTLNLLAEDWEKIRKEAEEEYSLSGSALIRILVARHLKEKEGSNGTTRLI